MIWLPLLQGFIFVFLLCMVRDGDPSSPLRLPHSYQVTPKSWYTTSHQPIVQWTGHRQRKADTFVLSFLTAGGREPQHRGSGSQDRLWSCTELSLTPLLGHVQQICPPKRKSSFKEQIGNILCHKDSHGRVIFVNLSNLRHIHIW